MTTYREIETREDIFNLVDSFYAKVRLNDLLGPIFERHITNWPEHLNRLTDFWETNLLHARSFKGNPFLKHQIVDATSGHTISALHFGIWLNLWFETVDALFSGEKAELAKNRARNMGTSFHVNLFNARPNGTD